MIQFTFNTLENLGILDRAYTFIANLANRHILSRHSFDTEYIANVFNAVDGFWLKYGRTHKYNESEIRVIVGSIVEMLRDNSLSADEVRKITRYVTSRWQPEIAEKKAVIEPVKLLPPTVEAVTKRSVDLYGQLPPGRVRTEDFVALGTGVIVDKLSDSDNTVVQSLLNVLKAK
jgi:hypothetical protein